MLPKNHLHFQDLTLIFVWLNLKLHKALESNSLGPYSNLHNFEELLLSIYTFIHPGPAERFKSWLGHPYMVGTICSPGWNRVKVVAKRWLVRVPIVPPVFTLTPAVPRSNIGRPDAYLYQKYIPTIYIEWRKSDQTKNLVHTIKRLCLTTTRQGGGKKKCP